MLSKNLCPTARCSSRAQTGQRAECVRLMISNCQKLAVCISLLVLTCKLVRKG
jgi:hypothetical protein